MKIVHELEREAWSNFVLQHPKGNIFQTTEMYDVYRNTKNYEPYLLGIVNGGGEVLAVLVAVMQREYNSFIGGLTARSIVFGGPLIRNGDIDVFRRLMEEYDSTVGKSALYTQVRNFTKMGGYQRVFTEVKYLYEDHLNIIIDLTKPEELLWEEVNSKRRNEIRRARREGTSVRELTRMSDIDSVYDILSEVYNNARIPFADKSMFTASYEILHPKGLCRYFGAFNDGILVGAICLLAYRKRLYDWYAGSLRQYLNKYPNDLLPWEVFKWGIHNGYVEFDFGGAGKPGKDYGVRDYKLKFGGDLVNFGRFEKVHKPLEYSLAKIGLSAWRFFKWISDRHDR
jgi:serine/alanine adding enzyme